MKKTLMIAALAGAAPALAQAAHDGHQGHAGHTAAATMAMPVAKNTEADPYAESMARMHERMMNATGADASETWTRQMIEHHRGAIDMSRIALERAKDAQVRAMSSKVIRDQEREVTEMQAWLKRRGKRAQ